MLTANATEYNQKDSAQNNVLAGLTRNDEIDRIRRTDRIAGFEGVDYSIRDPGEDTVTSEHARIPLSVIKENISSLQFSIINGILFFVFYSLYFIKRSCYYYSCLEHKLIKLPKPSLPLQRKQRNNNLGLPL